MRIAFLTGGYPNFSHTFIMREVEQLRVRGVDVHTFSLHEKKQGELLSARDREAFASTYTLLPPRVLDYLRAHVRALVTRPLAYLKTPFRAQRFAVPGLRGRLLALSWFVESILLWDQCRRRGIDHIHVHFAGTSPVVALLAVGFVRGPQRGRGQSLSWSMRVHGPADFLDQCLGAKAHEANFVVCISDYARSRVMALLDESHWDKLHVVHCAVDPQEFTPTTHHLGSQGGPLRILHVGRLVPQKGQGVLLEALAELLECGIDAHLTVAGDGPKRPALVRRCNELGISHRVTWAGAVGQDSIPDYYAAADVFCTSSFAEGVPVVLMEAMATELPVVATRIAGIPELVDHGVSGLLVSPGRADQVAAALERLADDSPLRMRMGQAGREKVEAEYELTKAGRELRDLFGRHLSTAISTKGESRRQSEPFGSWT